LNYPTP